MPSALLDIRLPTLEIFARLRHFASPALLHSSDPDHAESHCDIVAASPSALVSYAAGRLTIGGRTLATDDPLRTLSQWLPRSSPHSTFRYGFIGAFGYDLSRHRPPGARRPPDPTGLPDLVGGIYPWSIVVDHRRQETRLWWQPDTPPSAIDAVRACLRQAPRPTLPWSLTAGFRSEMTDSHYARAFGRVMHYLESGDCYQVNLARHYVARISGDTTDAAWAIYRTLCQVQPGPFGACMHTPWGSVLSVSPERLLRFEPDCAISMPIKGTAARHDDAIADDASRQALATSRKDQAENLMIVDLVRNDLGRFCQPGSIRVPRLFEVQSFANVHHLVSTVAGRPRDDATALDALSAVLPPGSVTGCPKVRATEIIDELEPVGRSMYCGAIGCIDAGGLLDCNVAIRTVVLTGDGIHCWGGGGIVADSVPEAEAREIDHKVGRLLQAIEALSSSSASRS